MHQQTRHTSDKKQNVLGFALEQRRLLHQERVIVRDIPNTLRDFPDDSVTLRPWMEQVRQLKVCLDTGIQP